MILSKGKSSIKQLWTAFISGRFRIMRFAPSKTPEDITGNSTITVDVTGDSLL